MSFRLILLQPYLTLTGRSFPVVPFLLLQFTHLDANSHEVYALEHEPCSELDPSTSITLISASATLSLSIPVFCQPVIRVAEYRLAVSMDLAPFKRCADLTGHFDT